MEFLAHPGHGHTLSREVRQHIGSLLGQCGLAYTFSTSWARNQLHAYVSPLFGLTGGHVDWFECAEGNDY